MNSAVCCCLRLQLSMFVSTFFFRFSQTDHTDLEMIKIKCTFGKRWHHLHIVKRTMRYWYVNIILSCEIRHHPLCIIDIMLCTSRINLSLRQQQQNPGAVMHIFVFLKTSLGQNQSQKKILTTDTDNCLKKARRVCHRPIVVMLSSLWFTGWCYTVVR